MSRLLAAALLMMLPGAAMAQYYQPYQAQQMGQPVPAWEPNAWQRNIPQQYRPRTLCSTVYGRGAGGNVIANTTCN